MTCVQFACLFCYAVMHSQDAHRQAYSVDPNGTVLSNLHLHVLLKHNVPIPTISLYLDCMVSGVIFVWELDLVNMLSCWHFLFIYFHKFWLQAKALWISRHYGQNRKHVRKWEATFLQAYEKISITRIMKLMKKEEESSQERQSAEDKFLCLFPHIRPL